jgi:spore coat polysaccharide biosynthesis protein SpsF
MLQIEEKSVLIAIQARSTSTRFPGKIFELIGSKTVLQHVIDQAKSAKFHVERSSRQKLIKCDVAVLHPFGDTNIINCFRQSGTHLVSGDEHDVLSRYIDAVKLIKPDFVVRLTSDCPLILDFVISKHINVAVMNDLDYVSNVDENCRTIADGFDCEVLSRKAMDWLETNAETKEDREHVTVALRKARPRELRMGFVASKLDTSHLKISLDTPEDLQKIREYYHNREFKLATAKRLFGKNVFEI